VHPLIMEEMAAERSRALHEQARRAKLAARLMASRHGRIARRVGLWFMRAGVRMAAGREDRVIVEFGGGGPRGRRAIRIDRRWGQDRVRG
jgi:hypothetical protein